MTNLAFLGHGTNLVFPEDTAEIRREIICKGGAVMSEYLPSQTYQKWQFVERNRLQAGLADLVIPVEAKAASGTAHTIRFARKYGRTLVGVRWEGANGIVDDLRANHDRLIDIFTDKGQKELDELVQALVRREHQDQYPFTVLERTILRELGIRKYTETDVARLVEAINTAAHQKRPQERPDNGTT
jgi:predicted Rossmann fold nucleotide-binding protein DprA/Smf involved in DNA uptake